MSAPCASPHVQRVLDCFDNVRPSGDGWTARCPAHRDRKNSLSLEARAAAWARLWQRLLAETAEPEPEPDDRDEEGDPDREYSGGAA